MLIYKICYNYTCFYFIIGKQKKNTKCVLARFLAKLLPCSKSYPRNGSPESPVRPSCLSFLPMFTALHGQCILPALVPFSNALIHASRIDISCACCWHCLSSFCVTIAESQRLVNLEGKELYSLQIWKLRNLISRGWQLMSIFLHGTVVVVVYMRMAP